MLLKHALPAVNDKEGFGVPEGLGRVVDAHVHVFPAPLFRSIHKWFDQHGWPIRYRLGAQEVLEYLLSRGVDHVVALQYAHRPGTADGLNRYMVELCRRFPGKVTGLATVFPGEQGCERILEKAFQRGLRGVKLHMHVQCFDMNGPEAERVYRVCSDQGKPLVIHAGREPKSPAYACDPYELCSAGKLERVLGQFPDLKICVPHLGMDELGPYRRLLEEYDTLWLDTAMALTDYLPGDHHPQNLQSFRTDRVLYGSDFPNIPYAWDRELKWIQAAGLSHAEKEALLWKNAAELFSIGKG
jgi:uncharacterized protein